MPNIRIKDIPTTASATSSTDFIGIDGSANGTRKLNAYSPTFGGNLTVSGTATATNFIPSSGAAASGSIGGSSVYGLEIWGKTGSFSDLIIYNGAGNTLLTNLTGTQNISLAGNLTVSGTGTSSVAGNLGIGTTSPSGFLANKLVIATGGSSNEGLTIYTSNNTANTSLWFADSTTGSGLYAGGIDYQHATNEMVFYTNSQGNVRITSGGNLLIGTTNDAPNARLHVIGANNAGFRIDQGSYNYYSAYEHIFQAVSFGTIYGKFANNGSLILKSDGVDSGNGRLQLATHSSYTGGIGFGPDNQLWRYNNVQLVLSNSSGTSGSAVASNMQLRVENSGNGGIQINVPDASTGGVYFGRAADGYYTAIERSGTNLQLRNNGTTALTLDSSQNATFEKNINAGGASNDADIRLHLTAAGDTSAKYAALWRNASYNKIFHLRADGDLYTSAGATITGAIAIGNTVQTAASVASTHKVTISIGGTTYYLLATNV